VDANVLNLRAQGESAAPEPVDPDIGIRPGEEFQYPRQFLRVLWQGCQLIRCQLANKGVGELEVLRLWHYTDLLGDSRNLQGNPPRRALARTDREAFDVE
jgi:hypothetical protein